MDKTTLAKIAHYLYIAETSKEEIPRLTKTDFPSLTIEEGYAIQEELIELKKIDGHKIIAPKMGITSKAKMEQMKVDEPIYGYLFDYMLEENEIIFSNYIHPKVEPEIGIVLKNDLKGPHITKEDVLENIDYIFACVEIIDSRYRNFDFTLPDVIADNTSARGAVFGKEKINLGKINLAEEKVKLYINDELKAEGIGEAVLDHPAESIAALANMVSRKDKSVKKNQPIMTGGMTQAVLIEPGDKVYLEYTNLGKIEFEVVE